MARIVGEQKTTRPIPECTAGLRGKAPHGEITLLPPNREPYCLDDKTSVRLRGLIVEGRLPPGDRGDPRPPSREAFPARARTGGPARRLRLGRLTPEANAFRHGLMGHSG